MLLITNFRHNNFQKHCESIIHNLIDVSSDDELKLLMMTIHGQSLKTFKNVYRDYVLNYKFNGRL